MVIEEIETEYQEEYESEKIIENDSMKQYLIEVGKYPLLNSTQEKALFLEYQETKSSKIKQKIINSNLRLVISIAKHYINRVGYKKIEFLDLIQEGNYALIEAVEKFDVEKNCKLSYFASLLIKQRIYDYIKGNSVKKYGVECTVVSLNQKLNLDENATLIDFIPSNDKTVEDTITENIIKEDISIILEELLSEREYKIITYRYGFVNKYNNIPRKRSLVEVGKMLGISGPAVRQIEMRVLKKLEKHIKRKCCYVEKKGTSKKLAK